MELKIIINMKKFKKILLSLFLILLILLTSPCKNKDKEIKLNNESFKNIVLIIGDGMGYNHAKASSLYYDAEYDFMSFKSISVNTDSLNSSGMPIELTDSAAGGTAIATGVLTKNGYVGKNQNLNDLNTILDYAKEKNMKTGIVTTDKTYGATPASFSAHSSSRSNTEEILLSQFESNIDLIIGSSSNTSKEIFNNTSNKYTLVESKNDLDNIDKNKYVYGLLDLEGNSENGYELKDIVESSINYLSNDNGFFLMVEQAHIDKYSHKNDFINTVKMVKSLSDTVNYIKNNLLDTLIIVTADHETGTLNISSNTLYPNKIKNINNNDMSYIYYSTGHSNTNICLYYYGFDYNFKAISYYNSKSLIKNTDTYIILKDLINKITG